MSWKIRVSILRRHMRARSERGNAAIEFAFVAPVFFALMLSILQIGVLTFGQFALQNSVTEAARLIRTGQAASIDPKNTASCVGSSTLTDYGTTQKWFDGQVCCNVTPLLDCSKLQIVVKKTNNFASGVGAYVDSGDPTNPDPSNYDPGDVCDVVLVRATYPWTVWFPGLASLLNQNWSIADGGSGSVHTLVGTAAFRNEPYNFSVSGC